MARSRHLITLLTSILLSSLATSAAAHGVQEGRYASRIPGWVILSSAALALILSFLLLNYFRRRVENPAGYRRLPVDSLPVLRGFLASPWLRGAARGISLALFLLFLGAGFFGNPDHNLAPRALWTLWWFGLTLFSFLVGNPWDALNPWRAVFEGASRGIGRTPCLGLRYPTSLGAWPALVLFLAFIWFELAWWQSEEPRFVALLALLYSIYLWAGMVAFGREVWLERADPFTRYFRVLGHFALIGPGAKGLEVRWWGSALRRETLPRSVDVFFVIAIMYSVTYDGFLATPESFELHGRLMQGAMETLSAFPLFELVRLGTLVAGLASFIGMYWWACALMARYASGCSTSSLARGFGYSLLPIAFGYFLAHYYTSIPPRFAELGAALLDPFGWGPRARGSTPPSGGGPWLTPGLVFGSEMSLILLGHLLAVLSAHHAAKGALPGVRRFVSSQVPLLSLMVLYTWVSLWIISRPILVEPLVPLIEEPAPMPFGGS